MNYPENGAGSLKKEVTMSLQQLKVNIKIQKVNRPLLFILFGGFHPSFPGFHPFNSNLIIPQN